VLCSGDEMSLYDSYYFILYLLSFIPQLCTFIISGPGCVIYYSKSHKKALKIVVGQ
jgi:hypothetical protein